MNLITRTVNYLKRKRNLTVGIRKARDLGVSFYYPNYIYKGKINQDSTVVDVGCANDPDFSIHIMNTHKAKCFGVDPTRKHFPDLKEVENKFNGKFVHLPFAVGAKAGKLTFHESKINHSGSLLTDHSNVVNDDTISYDVDVLSIEELKAKVGVDQINILKLDLEGAEYQLLEDIRAENLNGIEQIFVEFHHHCIEKYSIKDTNKYVKKIESLGFQSFTIDYHNFLFYR